MNRLVVDSSVALSWCFDDEASAYADSALAAFRNGVALVPALWCLEMANVLLISCRRGRLSLDRCRAFVTMLSELPIEVVDAVSVIRIADILELGTSAGLTAYDAAYLDLALRTELPLASLDRALVTAARKAKVRVFEPR